MSYFAKVNAEGIVEQVIVAEQDFINTLPDKEMWIETDPNTRNGIKYDDYGNFGPGTPLRKNFAAVGYTYDPVLDAFIPIKPWSTWTLDPGSCVWVAPKKYPRDGKEYAWDDANVVWVEVSI
jgi:hypothetical protein